MLLFKNKMKNGFLIVVYLITGVCLGFIVYGSIELGSNIYMKCDVTRNVMDKINNKTCWVYFIDVAKPRLEFVGEELHNTNITTCKKIYPVNSTWNCYKDFRDVYEIGYPISYLAMVFISGGILIIVIFAVICYYCYFGKSNKLANNGPPYAPSHIVYIPSYVKPRSYQSVY